MFDWDPQEAARAAASAEMIKGALWLAGGALLTGLTYSAARPGGMYLVFWGVIAYGGFRLCGPPTTGSTPTPSWRMPSSDTTGSRETIASPA